MRIGLAWVVGLVLLLLAAAAEGRERLSGPFYYRWGSPEGAATWAVHERPSEGWQPERRLVDVPQRGGSTIWIATAIDAAQGSTLFIPRTYLQVAVFVDGEPLYEDDDPEAGGRAFRLVDLPPGFERGWLTLHLTSGYSKTGLSGPLWLGARSEHLQAIVREDAPKLALIVILLLGPLVGVGLYLRGVERRAALGFAGWTVSVALWILFYTRVRDLWLPSPRLWVTIWAVALAVLVPSFLVFFNALFQRGERLLTVLLYGTAACSVLGVGMRLVDAPTSVSNPLLAIYRAATGVTLLAVGVVLARRWREGNQEAKVLALGYAALMILGVRDVLVSLGVVAGFDITAYWGHALFIGTGAWVLGHRLAALRHQRDAYADALAVHATEREMMLRDLHDGLGRITTGIGMLAEVAKRDPGNDRALDAIASLAQEGSTEIRAFIHGLDDEGIDWEALAATLRERAGHLVEASGAHYAFAAEVSPLAPPPTALLYVHVLRVAQEAITNALKHGGDHPDVSVSLTVGTKGVLLAVTNDKATDERARHGINLGAGLRNMRERARELGGELDLALEGDEARLTLQIPLPLRYAAPDHDGGQGDRDPDRDRGG